jgi:hypothetical protein
MMYGKMRPAPMPARYRLLAPTPAPAPGLLGAGPSAILPGLTFFAGGHPIGGPSEAYRGVSASSFPFYSVVLGSGAPLASEWMGLAGARMYLPGLRGEPFF